MNKIILFSFLSFAFYGQKQNNIWKFGANAGLDFNSGSPVAMPASSMNSFEGSASVSDNSGRLLFYTDGTAVYDKNNNVMPNGSGLTGGSSSTHVYIVQKPRDCTKYYIFHVGDHLSTNHEMSYTVVDMCLNGGLGDVVTTSKNILMQQPAIEKIAVTPHTNGVDMWIITHEWNTNTFNVYLLTNAGLSPAVQSSVGSVHPSFSTSGVGSCKINHAGTKLVVIGTNNGIFDKFDFNKTTGVLSNWVNLRTQYTLPWALYGLEFSPNDLNMYVTSIGSPNQLIHLQTSPPIQNVIHTFSLSVTDVYGALQLAPDGKIYMARNGYNYLGRINSPNNNAFTCGFVFNAVNISPNMSTLGLPSYVPNYTLQPPVNLGNDTTIACNFPINMNLSATSLICNPSYSWNTGATTSSINVTQTGTYIVTLDNVCGRDSDTIVIKRPLINMFVNAAPSATMCSSQSVTLTCSGVTSCTWQPSNVIGTSMTVSPLSNQSYTAYGSVGNCTTSAVQSIIVNPNPLITINPSTVNICPGQTATLIVVGATNYTWMPGNNLGNSIVVSPSTTTNYSVTGENSFGCASVGTVVVNVGNPGSIQVSCPSTVICIGETTTITASGAVSYTWNPGNIVSNTISVSPVGPQSYTVVSSTGSCTLMAVQSITAIPVPTISISVSDHIICGGSSATLTAGGASSYTWQPGNINGGSIIVSPNTNQTYTVNSGAGTCTSSAVQEVSVAIAVDLSVLPSYTVCKGQPLIVSANGAVHYDWEPGNFPDNDTIIINPVQSSTYNVTGIIGFCSDAGTITVIVPETVNADFTDNSVKVTWLDQVSFYNLSIHNEFNFWYFSNGQTSQISNEINPSVQFDDPGKYLACLKVTDDFGCSDTLCKVIEIGCPEDVVYIPNTFTPNDDGLNDIFNVVTLGQCIDKFGISIFDRWGEKIFESTDITKGWDGKVNNKTVKEDVYVYILEYTMINKKSFSKTGHVAVMK